MLVYRVNPCKSFTSNHYSSYAMWLLELYLTSAEPLGSQKVFSQVFIHAMHHMLKESYVSPCVQIMYFN